MEMEWTRGNVIGHGSSATVYLATSCHSTFDISAVKSAEISLSNSKQLLREHRIISSLSSPYIVTYKGFNFTKENNKNLFNLFMEYMPFGNLSEATRRNGGRLNEPAIAHYTRQIVEGLEYLHSKGVVHCDIKGSNILVCENGVKIGDLGCSKMIDETTPVAGTPMYMAPEVTRGEEQGYPCDVWSLGCTIVEMATGCSPWSNVEDPVNVLFRVAYSDEVPMIPSFLSEQAKDFLEKCFLRDSKKRWNCSQLLKHPFLVDKIQEFDSCSPTSVLEKGFWNCVEESESLVLGDLGKTSFVNCCVGRIKKLALCSREPCWKWGDENWITIRRNDEDLRDLISDELEKSCVSGRISGNYFCEDSNCKIRDFSSVVNSLNSESIERLIPQSTLDFL